jgi:hypothetical protein
VVVGDVEPLRLPVLVGVDKLVRQVLLSGVLTHLDVVSSNYSWVVGARLWLQAEELLKQDPVGLDPHEGLTEMDKDEDVKIPLGFRFKYSIP